MSRISVARAVHQAVLSGAIVTPGATMPPRVRAILAESAQKHAVSVRELIGPSRSRSIVAARRAAAVALRRHDMSLTEIGRYLGRHHTTVVHLLNPKRNKTQNVDSKEEEWYM